MPLTRGPRHHFFGYYEICAWNATGQYHLCLETDFHERPPSAQDEAVVGLVERGSTTFQPLARTQAFNLQQGAMLHWLPTTNPAREICYNAWQGNRHVAARMDIHSGHTQVLPRPVSGLSHVGILADLGASHFTWRSNREVFGWLTFEAGEWYYRLDAETGDVSAPFCPDLLTRNGHCSFSADGRWLLTDEHWLEHQQKGLVLFDMLNRRRVELGRYAALDRFRGEIRCDLHPRFNRSQTAVSFDSVHEGTR